MMMLREGAFRDRSVLVTGGGGFVGAVTVQRLVALGARVRTLLGPPSEAASLWSPPGDVQAAYGDIEDSSLLRRLVQGVDCVFHLAGPSSVTESFEAPGRYLRAHASGTATLVEQCVAAGVRRIVYVSSAEVYESVKDAAGAGRIPETHPRAPRSPYGIAKLAAELLLEACAADLQISIVRPFSIYGPGSSTRSLIGTLIRALDRGEAPSVSDLRPVRDYCFVGDAVEAIVGCGTREGPRIRAYNIASGVGVSVATLAQTLLRVAGREDLPIRERALDRPAKALTLRLIGDPTRAHDELGFTTRTPLEVGLARTLQALGAAPRARTNAMTEAEV